MPWCNWQHVGFWYRRVGVRAPEAQQPKQIYNLDELRTDFIAEGTVDYQKMVETIIKET